MYMDKNKEKKHHNLNIHIFITDSEEIDILHYFRMKLRRNIIVYDLKKKSETLKNHWTMRERI